MDIQTIIFYVVSGITALGGSSLGIGMVCAWIKKVISSIIEKLLNSKLNFDNEVVKLEATHERFDKASETFLVVGNTLNEFAKELKDVVDTNKDFGERLDILYQVIAIMCQNNEQMVANGTAKKCVDLMFGKQEQVLIEGDVSNE